jgi:DnaK suppressor protein
MTHQISSLEALLQSKRAQLRRSIRAQSSQLNVSEGEHDLMDWIQGMSRREEAVTFVDTLTRTLAAVNTALLAIRDGSYGTCAECDEPISSRRLEAIPWASHCIRCQEDIDRRNEMRRASPGWDQAA